MKSLGAAKNDYDSLFSTSNIKAENGPENKRALGRSALVSTPNFKGSDAKHRHRL